MRKRGEFCLNFSAALPSLNLKLKDYDDDYYFLTHTANLLFTVYYAGATSFKSRTIYTTKTFIPRANESQRKY